MPDTLAVVMPAADKVANVKEFLELISVRRADNLPCYPAWLRPKSLSVGIRPIESDKDAPVVFGFARQLQKEAYTVHWPRVFPPGERSIRLRKEHLEKSIRDHEKETTVEKMIHEYRAHKSALPFLVLTLPDGIEQLVLRVNVPAHDVYLNFMTRLLPRSPTGELFLTPYAPCALVNGSTES